MSATHKQTTSQRFEGASRIIACWFAAGGAPTDRSVRGTVKAVRIGSSRVCLMTCRGLVESSSWHWFCLWPKHRADAVSPEHNPRDGTTRES